MGTEVLVTVQWKLISKRTTIGGLLREKCHEKHDLGAKKQPVWSHHVIGLILDPNRALALRNLKVKRKRKTLDFIYLRGFDRSEVIWRGLKLILVFFLVSGTFAGTT